MSLKGEGGGRGVKNHDKLLSYFMDGRPHVDLGTIHIIRTVSTCVCWGRGVRKYPFLLIFSTKNMLT